MTESFTRETLSNYERGASETVTPPASATAEAPTQAQTENTNAVSAVPAAAEAEPAAVLQQSPPALQDDPMPRPERPFAERLAEYKRDNPSFDAALANYKLPPLPELVSRVVIRSETGPALLHHLALNPEAAARLSQLNGIEALTELQRIERTMSPSQSTPRPSGQTATAPARRAVAPARSKYSGAPVSEGLAEMLNSHRGGILDKEDNRRSRAADAERARQSKALRRT